MPNEIQCEIHGTRHETFVCIHLVGETAGLGFNRGQPTEDNPFPDACCDDCEIILAAHGGWTEESEKLMSVSLLCSVCYEQALNRNSNPAA
jgi:hypothetical protein